MAAMEDTAVMGDIAETLLTGARHEHAVFRIRLMEQLRSRRSARLGIGGRRRAEKDRRGALVRRGSLKKTRPPIGGAPGGLALLDKGRGIGGWVCPLSS